jgi:hypothetical protein|tara:strand:- start:458 stop:610 length:153 start_codon:yes stop_codon:yes gene_type:complete
MSESVKVCEENGHHDWALDCYDDFYMICLSAKCKICGAEAESRELGVDLE